MGITARMISSVDGDTHYAIFDGKDRLGRVGLNNGVLRWISAASDIVHTSVVDAVHNYHMDKYRQAVEKFGHAGLEEMGISAPKRPIPIRSGKPR